MATIAVYPGTFDPITLGHIDIIQRANQLFDKVIVAVAAAEKKSPMFALDTRMDFIREALPGQAVKAFDGLLVDFLQNHDASVVVRGFRGPQDLPLEQQLDGMNKAMMPGCETIFLNTAPEFSHISSSIVREIMRMDGDVSQFVPQSVLEADA